MLRNKSAMRQPRIPLEHFMANNKHSWFVIHGGCIIIINIIVILLR